jgi:hypothetical protein
MVVEMLANINCLQARNLVNEHEKDTLPQALEERAKPGGWPKQTAEVLSNVATMCTRTTKTRATPAQVLAQVEDAHEAAAEGHGSTEVDEM